MKTILVAQCYTYGIDKLGNDRRERMHRWIDWHDSLHTEFKVDRYGENRIPQDYSMDAYCQARLDIPLSYS